MIEEELREKITWILTEWNAWSCEDRARYKFDYANQILALIKEAGWKSPEEVDKIRCEYENYYIDLLKERKETT